MNILGRARKMLGGAAPPEPSKPQYYQVACPEGHVLRGLRTEGYQALRCPTCGDGIFVLPASPLPEPPAPPADRGRRRAAAPIDDAPIVLADPPAMMVPEADIEWVDHELKAPAAPSRDDDFLPDEVLSPTPAKPAVAPASLTPRPRPARKPAAAVPTVTLPERPGLVARVRRRPLPWIMAGIVLIVAATVAFNNWRIRRQNLPQVAEINHVEGIEALNNGEFDAAKDKLARAAVAFEELGDDKAAQVRQIANEAAILADLVGTPLEDVLDEAAYHADQWPSRFQAHYQGRSILLDAPLVARADGQGLELDTWIVGQGKAPKFARIDLDGFQLLEGAAPSKPGGSVVFGARIASVQLGERGIWRIGLVPDSGVFMTQASALSALPGWDDSREGRR